MCDAIRNYNGVDPTGYTCVRVEAGQIQCYKPEEGNHGLGDHGCTEDSTPTYCEMSGWDTLGDAPPPCVDKSSEKKCKKVVKKEQCAKKAKKCKASCGECRR